MSHGYRFSFAGEVFVARASGALYWPAKASLLVSDLHLGRSQRYARLGRGLLPPYETHDTLERLQREIDVLAPQRVISLGDSFDDQTAQSELPAGEANRLRAMTAARDWLWVTGNHDPDASLAPFGGQVLPELAGRVALRHIRGQAPDISGHLHPVMRLAGQRWRCFVLSAAHVILPAFGSYTGGLALDDAAFDGWARPGLALICGREIFAAPLSSGAPRQGGGGNG